MSGPAVRRHRLPMLRSRAVDSLLAGAGRAFCVTVIATLVALASQVVLARILGPREFGVFACVTAWLNILALIATLGSDSALVRLLPKYAAEADWPRFRGALGWSRRLTLGISMLLAGLMIVPALLFRDELDRATLLTWCAGAAGLPLLGLAAVNQSALQGLKRIGLSQTPRLILRPVALSLTLLAIAGLSATPITAPAAMAVNVAAFGLTLAVGARWLSATTPSTAKQCDAVSEGQGWTRLSVPLCLISGMSVLLQESSVILVGWLDDPASAGIYSVAVRLVRLMAFGMAAGNAIARPLFSELHARSDYAELQRVGSTAALISVAGATACGAVLLAGRRFALEMFGDAFEAGAGVIAILACGQFINAAMGPASELLSMTGHERSSARILAMVALLSLAVGYPVVRQYGMTGAAVVASGIMCVQNVWTWLEVRRRIGVDSSPLGLLASLRSSKLPLSSTGS